MGGTLKQLGDDLHNMGMKFGLWFEPEMISEDSDLYRAHPDWALQIQDGNPLAAGTSWCWICPEKRFGTICWSA